MIDVVMGRFKLEKVNSRLILVIDNLLAAEADAAKLGPHLFAVISHCYSH